MFTISDTITSKALLLLALSENDGIHGRKKLQKIIYLANCAGWNVIKDYRFYYYGPYSDYVLSEIQDLSEEGLIDIEMKSGNKPYYSHKLSDKGRLLLMMISKRIKKDLFENTKRLVSKLDKFSSDDLEIMASLYYIHCESPSLGNTQLIQELQLRKPHFSIQQINKSFIIFGIMKQRKTYQDDSLE
jgi:uncharacterized protein